MYFKEKRFSEKTPAVNRISFASNKRMEFPIRGFYEPLAWS